MLTERRPALHGDICSTMATIEQELRALNQMQPRVPNAVLEKVHEWKGMGENLLKSLVDCFSDIECREQGLVSARVSLEKREKDLEEREKKFDLFEEEKKGELMLREENLDEQLRLVREHIEILEAERGKNEGFRRYCEKLKEIEDREREVDAVCGSIEKRLRDVEMKEKEFDKLYNGKLRELKLKEGDLNKEKKRFAEEVKLVDEKLKKKQKTAYDLVQKMESALKMVEKMKVVLDERFKESHESLTAKLNEADWVKESLDRRFKELEKIEEEFKMIQEEKTRELESKEQELRTMRMELFNDVNMKKEQLSEEQKCSEHMVSEKAKEIESLDDSPKDADLSRESPNKHGKILEMFVNRTEKDLELMGDEIFKALSQSSDPAKFVLDAVDGLYTSRLGNGNEDSKLRGVCILLLDQLTKMSPIIEPLVRGEAIKLATEWMSKLNTAAENPLEVLVLLHLLAAYNLASCFEKNELFSFAKLVIQHKQAPGLCRILGLAEKIPGNSYYLSVISCYLNKLG